MDIQAAHFAAVEWPGAAAAEYGELVAGLIDGAISIDALRNGEGGAASMGGGDELGSGARAEAGEMGRVVPRGEHLENAEAVLAVGDEGEGTGGNHADFYIIDVVELAFGGKALIEFGSIRFFNVDDREALLSCRDVSVSARNVNIAGIFEGDENAADWSWLSEVGNVKNFQAVMIDDEGISEL